MKNKLLARIAASAISVAMLGSAVFAAETGAAPSINDVEGDATTKLLSFMVGETNIIKPATAVDQVTMMSYLVAANATYTNCDYVDEATTPMIALDQVSYADSFASGVKVAASKLDNTKKVVVKRGASDGSTDKWIFGLAADKETITIMNGATATEIDVVDGVATLPKTADFDKTSDYYAFKLYSWVAIDNETKAEGTEYIISADADTKVAVADLTGKTLYAKFVADFAKGDINKDGEVNISDYPLLKSYVLSGGKANTQKIDQPIYVVN